MSYTVEFTNDALSDLENIVDFIAADSIARGNAFVQALLERVHRKIGEFPLSGTVIGDRRFTVFHGYLVAYFVDEAKRRVVIVLVTEGHRDWRVVLEERR